MSGSIKLTPEQAKARQESRVERIIERQQRVAKREIERREYEARVVVLPYVCILIFAVGMMVGTWL